jgi:hypothetical protein
MTADSEKLHRRERVLAAPVYSQPQPTPDPTVFKVKHPSDNDAYKIIDQLNAEGKLHALPFPAPRGGAAEPRLTLEAVFGGNAQAIANITAASQIVFHATGDCGSTSGPTTQNEVTDKMIGDFDESHPMEAPQFCLLLGDVVYNFGETQYYYDQFYEPYRNYHAPVLAAAGNHDGMLSPLAHETSLSAYLRNFCSDPAQGFVVTPEAGGLSRTAQIQPGVFFTFDAPFVRILVFYSNTLEDPGVIADVNTGDSQLIYLEAALNRVKSEAFAGALLVPTTIRNTPSAVSTRPAPISAPRWIPCSRGSASGPMPFWRATPTPISASPGCGRMARKSPTSRAATAATTSRSSPPSVASRCERLSCCRPRPATILSPSKIMTTRTTAIYASS